MTGCVILAMLASTVGLTPQQRLVEGKPDSPVRVLIYEDLQCPDCAVFRRMLDDQLLPKYGAKVAFEHRDFPLAKHSWARRAAVVARFFQERSPEAGVAWRKHIATILRQTTPDNFNERVAAFAKSNGLDPQKAVAAQEDPRYAALVEKDFQDGVARGVSKTPTVFVNGVPFIETFAVEEISKGIDAALAEAK